MLENSYLADIPSSTEMHSCDGWTDRPTTVTTPYSDLLNTQLFYHQLTDRGKFLRIKKNILKINSALLNTQLLYHHFYWPRKVLEKKKMLSVLCLSCDLAYKVFPFWIQKAFHYVIFWLPLHVIVLLWLNASLLNFWTFLFLLFESDLFRICFGMIPIIYLVCISSVSFSELIYFAARYLFIK